MKGRLSRLRELGLLKASEMGMPGLEPYSRPDGRPGGRQGRKPAVPGREDFLPGWDRIAPHTYARTMETGLFLEGSGEDGFDSAHFANQRLRQRRGLDPEAPGSIPYNGLSFFDLETTGLSGGTGTIAFLAAVGYFEANRFFVTQVFIDDFPGEPAFLDFTINTLAERPRLVTYNGAAFDLPLLRTRCVMNSVPVPEFTHIDALHFSRRLWRRTLGSCSLQALEANVLGEAREEDVPGFLIPRLWLEYSGSTGNPGGESLAAMERVARHNALDVRSLARLFLRIEGVMKEPVRRWADERVNSHNLAMELVAAGRREEGFAILEEDGSGGNQAALRQLARLYRRSGKMDDYERVVGAMDFDSAEGCIEMAKFHEHVKRDAKTALAFAERALLLSGSRGGIAIGDEEALGKRLRRLRGKMERREKPPGRAFKTPDSP